MHTVILPPYSVWVAASMSNPIHYVVVNDKTMQAVRRVLADGTCHEAHATRDSALITLQHVREELPEGAGHDYMVVPVELTTVSFV